MSETSQSATGGTQEATSQSSQSTSTQSTSTGAATDWTSGLNDEMRGYVQTKGFKDVSAVLDSYRGLEKTIGAPPEHIIKLPKDMSGPDGKAVWQRLGAPKEAKDYKIEMAKEFGDEKLGEAIRDMAFQNNMTHAQTEGLVKWMNERQQSLVKAHQDAVQTKLTDAQAALKKEWGAAFDQNVNIADQAAIKFGLDENVVQALGRALGPDKTMQLLYSLGRGTGEAQFVTGQTAGGGALAPNEALHQIEELKNDQSFLKRFTSGEAEAVRKWNKLHEQAYAAPQ